MMKKQTPTVVVWSGISRVIDRTVVNTLTRAEELYGLTQGLSEQRMSDFSGHSIAYKIPDELITSNAETDYLFLRNDCMNAHRDGLCGTALAKRLQKSKFRSLVMCLHETQSRLSHLLVD